MKKLLLLIGLLSLGRITTYAQKPRIEKSDSFDAPEQGWNKVLQLKNGNTFYFHLTKKEGIEVNIYNKERKLTATKMVTSELWDATSIKRTAILGLYEINQEPVLFVMQAEGRVPTLYRVRFDPFKGNITKEDELGTLPKVKLLGMNTEGVNIIIEKDPQSDCYAAIFFNGYARDRDERIKVVHYDGSHKVINYAYYESPDESFRYLRFIGAVVDGSKRVYIGTYGSVSAKGKDAHVFVSRLNVTDSTFTNKTLDFTEDFKDTKSVMYYNHTSNTIQMLTLSYATTRGSYFFNNTSGVYTSFVSYIDPETLSLKGVKPATSNKINEYAHNTLELNMEYHGLPHQMIVNKDNSLTVLSEEMAKELIYDQKGNLISATTMLGAIGVSEYNEDGTEKSGYVIMKRQWATGLIDPLYIAARSKGRWSYQRGAADYNCYLSYDYINTSNNRYILFNDNPKNFNKEEDDRKRKAVVNVNKLNTVCYNLAGTTVNKYYLFGDPGENDHGTACLVDASDYMQSTNTYATVAIERAGRDTQAKIVWVTFE